MFQHPSVTTALIHDRQRELVAEADRQRLLARILRASLADDEEPASTHRAAHRPLRVGAFAMLGAR